MDKYAVEMNIGENTSSNFGAVSALIRKQDKKSVERALHQTIEYLRESKGMRFDFDTVQIVYIDRKEKHNNPDTENAFVVRFEAGYTGISLDAQYHLYTAIGMMATALLQEAIAFTISAEFGGRQIVLFEALTGLYKHLWGGGDFDRNQFITMEQAERGEF